jgi:hypothetical protein
MAAPDISEETQTVTDDRAQVPNELGKPAEDVKHLCNRLTANSLIRLLIGLLRRTVVIVGHDSLLDCFLNNSKGFHVQNNAQQINCKAATSARLPEPKLYSFT